MPKPRKGKVAQQSSFLERKGDHLFIRWWIVDCYRLEQRKGCWWAKGEKTKECKSFTNGKPAKRFPFWRERIKAANFICCLCESSARASKIFYPKISRGKAECFLIKKTSMQKLCKWKACSTFSVLERKGTASLWLVVESRMLYVNPSE